MAKQGKRIWAAVAALLLLLCLAPEGRAQGPPPAITGGGARVYWDQLTLKTYNYYDYLGTRYNSTYNWSYKYLRWGSYGANKEKVLRTYDVIVLENDYLALTIIPSLGGRIYRCVFKPTGHNEFYSNTIVKPTHWGPPEQDWWLAVGGMEWCLPVEEHGYEWGVPWTSSISTDAAGATVVLTDTAQTDRLRAAIAVHLPHERAAFRVTPRIENPTAAGLWFKYWTNCQVAPGPANTLSADLRFVLPVDQVTVHSTGDDRLPGGGQAMSWPLYGGRDWSRLGTWNELFGFFARPAAAADFQGVYDEGAGEGLVRVFDADVVRGAKFFAWGWNNPYPAYYWTEGPSTYYAEMHGGLAPTFADSAYLPAGGAIEWSEWWYPLAGTGGISAATADAVLRMQADGAQVQLGAQPTASQPGGTLALWRPGEPFPLYYLSADLAPDRPYSVTLPAEGAAEGLVLVYLDREGRLLAAAGPPAGGLADGTADTRPPQARVHDLPPYVTSAGDLLVSWSGTDGESCVLDYDLQVRDGYDGPWTDWLTRTTSAQAHFAAAQPGHTFFFRCRARDLYGNLGAYGSETWGDAFTSLLPTPAPVLVTSRQWAGPASAVAGDALTYTLSLRNTGSAAATVRVTETLPAEVTAVRAAGPVTKDTGQWAAEPGAAASEEWVWQGELTAGERLDLHLPARVRPGVAPSGAPVVSTMTVAHQGATLTRHASFILGRCTLLPLLFRAW